MRTNHLRWPLVVFLGAVIAGRAWGLSPASPLQAQAQSQAGRVDPAQAAHMREHFGLVTRIHEAVIRGDLEAARAPALALATHQGFDEALPQAARYGGQMSQVAQRIVDAPDLATAASATASLLVTCGDCHHATGRMPEPGTVVRRELGGVVGHMLDHQTALDAMYRGLVVPSAASWREGVLQLRRAPLRPRDLPRDSKLTSDIVALETLVHEISGRALKDTDANMRATSYAQLLTTCGRCHTLHKALWGPSGGGR